MEYVGKWTFHSIGTINDKDEFVYMTPDEFLASPMPYIDENDKEAVEEELSERKTTIGMQAEINEDGNIYFLIPIPQNVEQSEIEEAVKSGEITLRNGMMLTQAVKWELRGEALWYDTEIEGEAFGEKTDSWVKGIDDNGYFTFMTMRFTKA